MDQYHYTGLGCHVCFGFWFFFVFNFRIIKTVYFSISFLCILICLGKSFELFGTDATSKKKTKQKKKNIPAHVTETRYAHPPHSGQMLGRFLATDSFVDTNSHFVITERNAPLSPPLATLFSFPFFLFYFFFILQSLKKTFEASLKLLCK